MTRVKVFVEGQTEETFVRDVLAPYFYSQNISLIAILAQTSPGHKGGIVSYAKIRHQLERLCKEDSHCYVTTLMDFYKYPKDAPGLNDENYTGLSNCYDKVRFLQEKFIDDIPHRNFLPFLMLHEFETLLFCQLDELADWIEGADIIALKQATAHYNSPEEINDGERTAPSKRILAAAPRYKKTLHGPIVPEVIGIDAIRNQCPHFNSWIERLTELNEAVL